MNTESSRENTELLFPMVAPRSSPITLITSTGNYLQNKTKQTKTKQKQKQKQKQKSLSNKPFLNKKFAIVFTGALATDYLKFCVTHLIV